MYLLINNLEESRNYLALILDKSAKKHFFLILKNKRGQDNNILKGLDNLLLKTNKRLKDIKGIIVVNGPGSFVGIRVALSVANTLAWLLKVPVIGLKNGEKFDLIKIGIKKLNKKMKTVRPFYGKLPNISQPKNNN